MSETCQIPAAKPDKSQRQRKRARPAPNIATLEILTAKIRGMIGHDPIGLINELQTQTDLQFTSKGPRHIASMVAIKASGKDDLKALKNWAAKARRKILKARPAALIQKRKEKIMDRQTAIRTIDLNAIAAVCHAVNKAWCEQIGDFSQVDWHMAPKWQQESALNGVLFHLENPHAAASASHENWWYQKLEGGWTYGEDKCPGEKTHPCMVPFDELPQEQQIKDRLFQAVVHALTPEQDEERRIAIPPAV